MFSGTMGRSKLTSWFLLLPSRSPLAMKQSNCARQSPAGDLVLVVADPLTVLLVRLSLSIYPGRA
jgi:hypothetical protein